MTGTSRTFGTGRGGLPEWLPLCMANTAAPNQARFYDAMLSGKENLAADRDLVHAVTTIAPGLPRLFRRNRAFAAQATERMIRSGVTQILDLGCGLPTADNSHEIAQRRDPGARVVYVDHDPAVVVHGHALLASDAQTAVVEADVRDADAVLGAEPAIRVLDLSRPVGVLLAATLHHLHDDDDPHGVVRAYMERLAPGSMLAVSHFHAPDVGRRLVQRAHAVEQVLADRLGSGWFRSSDAITAFFDGLDLDEAGVRPPPPLAGRLEPRSRAHHRASLLLCGLARKP